MYLRRASVLLLALSLNACASPAAPDRQLEQLRQSIVVEALGQIGRPYRFGGAGPEGYDCSGLVYYVFGQVGIKLPRSASEQHAAGRPIELAEAEPGDLLFYRIRGGVDHVAIYLGDGRAVHAPAARKSVIVAAVELPYWKQRFVDAVRVLR